VNRRPGDGPQTDDAGRGAIPPARRGADFPPARLKRPRPPQTTLLMGGAASCCQAQGAALPADMASGAIKADDGDVAGHAGRVDLMIWLPVVSAGA